MDIKVAAAAGLAVMVGLGVQAGMHHRHQLLASSRPHLVMMQASNDGSPVEFPAEFNASWQDQTEQLAEQKDCLRKSLESTRSEIRNSVREQISSAREERQAALAQARAASEEARSEIRE